MFSWVAVSDDKCDQGKSHGNYRTIPEQKKKKGKKWNGGLEEKIEERKEKRKRDIVHKRQKSGSKHMENYRMPHALCYAIT